MRLWYRLRHWFVMRKYPGAQLRTELTPLGDLSGHRTEQELRAALVARGVDEESAARTARHIWARDHK